MAKRKPGEPKRGALPTKVDWSQVDGMLHIQCTGEEIASVLGFSYDTLARACEKDKKMKFAEYSAYKRQGGKASLRRKQWKLADINANMAIFLGKNMLDQTDRREIQSTNVNSTKIDITNLSDEELDQLKKLQQKMEG